MGNLNADVKKLLEETKTWVLSTCDDKPNAVPVFFTSVDDSELIVFDVFMVKTLDNIKKNSNVAITVFNDSTLQRKKTFCVKDVFCCVARTSPNIAIGAYSLK